MEQILNEFEKKIELHLKEMNLELADLEYVRDGGYNYLRVYVEKLDGTTTLDDCIDFSREIDGIADDLIEEKFFLEVSTPGVERRLKKPKDFVRFLGEKVNVQAKSNIEGAKRFVGKLEKFEEDYALISSKNLSTIFRLNRIISKRMLRASAKLNDIKETMKLYFIYNENTTITNDKKNFQYIVDFHSERVDKEYLNYWLDLIYEVIPAWYEIKIIY